jgi:phospho-N-acetylmuramoyl-pentapeptide-transferase
METKSSSPINIFNPSGRFLVALLIILLLTLGLTFFSPLTLLPLLVCTIVTATLGLIIIPILQKIKAGQVIQEDGPQSHLKKAGTPTMGGIFFLPVSVIIALIWGGFSADLIAVSLVTLAYGIIGWLDDWQILRQKSNKGITPRQKLILQISIAILFCLWSWFTQPENITSVHLPAHLVLSLGVFFWLLAGFVMVAESNATNLTDGVDGLAGGTGAIAFLGMAILAASTHPDLTVFALCLGGGCLGFVLHNRNPASVFMGDTGSLALGASLAALGIITQNLWALFIISGIFFLESISVIAQVSYYKATKGADGKGKRLFKMAPIHHHLELTGWSETQIVGFFYLLNTLLVFLALIS